MRTREERWKGGEREKRRVGLLTSVSVEKGRDKERRGRETEGKEGEELFADVGKRKGGREGGKEHGWGKEKRRIICERQWRGREVGREGRGEAEGGMREKRRGRSYLQAWVEGKQEGGREGGGGKGRGRVILASVGEGSGGEMKRGE